MRNTGSIPIDDNAEKRNFGRTDVVVFSLNGYTQASFLHFISASVYIENRKIPSV